MGKKYLEIKENSLESSVFNILHGIQEEKEVVAETNKNDKSDDGDGMDAVQPKAVKKKFANRKDKDIDNDGDVDSSDKYLHKRRKAVSKAITKKEGNAFGMALKSAKDKGEKTFVVSGKTYSVKEEVDLDEAKGIDPKTAKIIAKMIARGKLDYNFEYGLSRNNIDDIKKQGGKPPRGVGPEGGGSLYDLLKGLGDTDNDIYLDGADLVDGAKTIGKWKGMTIGDMLKKARLRYEEVDLDEASARSDAKRSMSRDRDLSRKGSSLDKDDFATDDDVKAASKNIMMQLRKAANLRGTFAVEFGDKKKVKVDPKVAQAAASKYNSLRRPADKEKFQMQIAKSYKDMLGAIKESTVKESKFDTINKQLKGEK